MPQNVQPKKSNYTVKNVETVVAGKDVRARLFTLAPGEVIPWHSHSEIADHFCGRWPRRAASPIKATSPWFCAASMWRRGRSYAPR
jgi:hypothetical protein